MIAAWPRKVEQCIICCFYWYIIHICVTLANVEDTVVDGEMGNIIMLNETDIPGASLNGKAPSELNVVQLKRWLACRGAPVSGKKPELVER